MHISDQSKIRIPDYSGIFACLAVIGFKLYETGKTAAEKTNTYNNSSIFNKNNILINARLIFHRECLFIVKQFQVNPLVHIITPFLYNLLIGAA
jgi:hypothetical protein